MQNADIGGGGGGEMQLGLVGGEKGRLDTIRRPLCKRSVSQSTNTLHRIAFEYILDFTCIVSFPILLNFANAVCHKALPPCCIF